MNFKNIIDKHELIIKKLIKIKEKDDNLNNIYLNYIQKNNDKSLGLDSFLFQNTLFDYEYEFLNKYYNLINNRIYCHYYKLYRQITKYINENYYEKISYKDNNYPPYKDLEKFKLYNFNTIIDLHHDIDILISLLEKYNNDKQTSIKSINDNLSKGFKIDLFLYDFINEKKQLEQNIDLYKTYLNIFYNYHDQYFKTLENKINKFFYEYSILFDLQNNKNNYELFFDVNDNNKIEEENEKMKIFEERIEKERLEKERLEKERLEKERLEKERLEKERLEKEKQEKERLEKERLEKERLEKERLEKEKQEKEKQEKERLEKRKIRKRKIRKRETRKRKTRKRKT